MAQHQQMPLEIVRESPIPSVRLSSGLMMPMLAFGAGFDSNTQDRSAEVLLERVRTALTLGYTHLDTAEVYPHFDRLHHVLSSVPRSKYFLTCKLDPTRPRQRVGRCRASGEGCFGMVEEATTQLLGRLRVDHVDLLLLHRPPPLQANHSAQCTRLQEQWRAMEAAYERGHAKAIGVSNYCHSLLVCLNQTARIRPAVLQGQLHIGMGSDPYGYVSYARSMEAAFMAYSVLGGVSGDYGKILSSAAVRRAASQHSTSPANIALGWIARLGLPFIVTSNSSARLASNQRLFEPSWGTLSDTEMMQLSQLTRPPGRPSHWGDCEDAGAPELPAHTTRTGSKGSVKHESGGMAASDVASPEPTRTDVRALFAALPRTDTPSQLKSALGAAFAVIKGPTKCGVTADRNCQLRVAGRLAVEALNRSLDQMGDRLIIPARLPWAPIEGSTAEEILSQNPDPYGALQRGEIPAIILRQALPKDLLTDLALRMFRFGKVATFPKSFVTRHSEQTERARCALMMAGFCACDWSGINASLPSRSFARTCTGADPRPPTCTRSQLNVILDSNTSDAAHDCRKRLSKLRQYGEYGNKLLHTFSNQAGTDRCPEVEQMLVNAVKLRRALHALGSIDGCHGQACEPHQILLASLQSLSGGRLNVTAAHEGPGEEYIPGIFRTMGDGFHYPMHFDSIHSHAWPYMRFSICDTEEKVDTSTEMHSVGIHRVSPLRRNAFSTSVILTLQEPSRAANPVDLEVYRTRWPALLLNCSIHAQTYGVGGRLSGEIPRWLREDAVNITGRPGDLYIFNSEFIHYTPKIRGNHERVVLGAMMGYSSGNGEAEVWS
jgi:diketogulonate reductase-like aldo/keto reductase